MDITAATAGLIDDSGALVDDSATAEVSEQDTTSTDEGSGESTEAPAGEGASTEDGSEAEGEQPAVAAHIDLPLSEIDRDSLPPELQGAYDRMKAAQASMNADYTRKTQAAAAAVKQTSTLEQQVATLTTQLAALQAPQQFVPNEQEGESEPDYYEGLGDPITPEQVMASDDPTMLFKYTNQVAEVAARRTQYAFAMQVLPEVQAVRQQTEQQRSYEAQQALDTYFGANPDLDPFRGEMASAMQAGFASNLEEAGEVVRARHFAPEREAEAFRLGAAQAEAKIKAAQTNQRSFSVPSSSTAPAVNPYAGKSLAEVTAGLLAEFE
jgi:hypothetical protein